MCLIIHKPADQRIPEELLRAAAVHNPDGWGLMGIDHGDRIVVRKGNRVDSASLIALERQFRSAEYALHLRRRTHGDRSDHNTHPFRVSQDIELMHNGTLKFSSKSRERSDTWHFVHEVLRPLSQRHPGLLSDYGFVRVLEMALRPHNRLALLDRRLRRIVLVNREYGTDFEGLWLSSTRWIDRRLLPLANAPQPQALRYTPAELRFVS